MPKNLLTVLNLEGDPLHASVVAWLLTPEGEHGLGDALLSRLRIFAQHAKLEWAGAGEPQVSVALREGVHRIEVNARGDRLVLVIGGHLPGADAALIEAIDQGQIAIGLHLVPGSFTSETSRQHPVWTGQDLLKVLEGCQGGDAYSQFLIQYRERLLEHVRQRARRRGRPTGPSPRPTPRPTTTPPPASREVVLEPSVMPAAPAAGTSSEPSAVQQARLDRAMAALADEEDYPDEPDLNLAEEMLPSDDMSRVYVVKGLIGKGGQGLVFDVEVQGEQTFDEFSRPVERAALKIARPVADAREALEKERAIYARSNRGIVKMLDSGTANDSLYLILERLQPHPSERWRRHPVDPATAIDTFVNLLEILQGIHFNRERPLLLFDIKPDNIMLRMSNADGEVGEEEYLRRIATGAYEPVFVDVGCAESRTRIEDMGGRLDEFIGTPVYLPPESTPVVSGAEVQSTYSVKTDVYALTLTFYELLSGARAYAHRGLYQLKGQDLLLELIGHKHAHVDPIDVGALQQVPGFSARVIEEVAEILRAGLHPDPDQRATLQTLGNMARKAFQVVERRKKEVGDYRFDAVKGLRLWQDRFPRISPERNPYLL